MYDEKQHAKSEAIAYLNIAEQALRNVLAEFIGIDEERRKAAIDFCYDERMKLLQEMD